MEQALTQVVRKGAGVILACALSATLTIPTFPADALADVRKTDIVSGETVESRGLTAAEAPSVDAEHVCVMDADGNVYFERNADEETKIASITKVMTATVALDYAPLDAEITVSETAASVGESSAQLLAGDTMTLSDAVKALLVVSGNDAAEAIAECVGAMMLEDEGGDSSDEQACVSRFVDAMNEKASEIGMQDSLFCNPHGLDDGEFAGDHHSTARDVAKMCQYAMRNDAFRDSVDNSTATIEVVRDGVETTLELESTDLLLDTFEGACGVKTGFTDAAGYSFAGACNRGNGDLYAIVIGASEDALRFEDASTLFEWVYDNTVEYPLAHTAETVQADFGDGPRDVPVLARVAVTDRVDETVDATLSDPDASIDVFALDGNVSQEVELYDVSGAVDVGDVVGKVTFKQRNQVVATCDLVSCESVAAPSFFESVATWWDRFFRSFSGQPSVAESEVLNDTPLIVDKTQSASS